MDPTQVDLGQLYQPAMYSVPLEDLANLCRMAKDAAQDVRNASAKENAGDDPASRRRYMADAMFAEHLEALASQLDPHRVTF